MKTIKLRGRVDAQHRLTANVPPTVPPGPVELDLLVPEPETGAASDEWEAGVALAWADELSDARQDIYGSTDGEPVNESR